jgi:hypothetical protein
MDVRRKRRHAVARPVCNAVSARIRTKPLPSRSATRPIFVQNTPEVA